MKPEETVKAIEAAIEAALRRCARVGVALSGGADSVALLKAVAAVRPGDCVALHCNFGLRGDESDADEAFCRDLCRSLGVELAVVRFDTRAAMLRGESLEMACRRLRYEWFAQMAAERHLDCVAVAHHADDNIETALLNMLRGSGPRGLAAMARQRDIYVRPLLVFSRAEILDYLREKGVDYRTDSSNLTSDYRRNALRNEVIPLIDRHFPAGRQGILRTIASMRSADAMIGHYVELLTARYCVDRVFDIDRMRLEVPEPAALLMLAMKDVYGVDAGIDTAADIVSCRESGRRFLIDGRKFEYSRGKLAESPSATTADSYPVSLDSDITTPLHIAVNHLPATDFAPAKGDTSTAWFDAAVTDGTPNFELRHWREGDRMKPFGMKGSRLLSDIFTDAKFSLRQKREAWLLTRNDQILWIVGLRASALYPVTPSSSKIIKLELQK